MADEKFRRDDTAGEEVSAFGERVKGAAKDAAGSVTGNRRLEREGERENAEGRARQARNDVFEETDGVPGRSVTDRTGGSVRGYSGESGTVREEISATGERMKGAAKDATGSVLGLERMEREGEIENARGRVRQAANDAAAEPDVHAEVRNRRYVTSAYDTPEHAARAYNDLTTRHGYRADDVSVLMSDDTRRRHFGNVKPGAEFSSGTKAAEGAGIGGATGLGIGAALGALLATATAIAIPGIGLIVAGPIAGAIAGAGAGAATGTLIGALIGVGFPEERAKVYDRYIREGGIVLGTRARDEAHATELERDLRTHGARDVVR
jgi:uncharacterized protein YjbJ (UPF0337 family)